MKQYYISLTYRSFVGLEKDIFKNTPFDSYDKALDYGRRMKIFEDGLSIYSSENGIDFKLVKRRPEYNETN